MRPAALRGGGINIFRPERSVRTSVRDVDGLVALAISIGLMVGFSALKISAGLCVLAGLLAFGLLALGPQGFLYVLYDGLLDVDLWDLTVSVALVAILGSIMRELGQIDGITDGLRGLGVRGRSLMALGPAIFGLLPVPGGAILSASMVEEEGRDNKADPRASATANLLFRHVNFFLYPLSPTLMFLASSEMLNMSVYLLILILFPYFLAHTASSCLASFHGVKAVRQTTGEERDKRKALIELGKGLLPVLIAPILMVIGLMPSISLCFSLLAALVMAWRGRETLEKAFTGLKKSRAISFSSPVLFAMLFRSVFKASSAPEAIAGLLGASWMPMNVLFFLSALGLGLATGSAILATVVIMPEGAGADIGALIYSGAVFGYMISPLHLCFIVSAEYFGLRQADMYPRLVAYLALAIALSLAFSWLPSLLMA